MDCSCESTPPYKEKENGATITSPPSGPGHEDWYNRKRLQLETKMNRQRKKKKRKENRT